jgi:pyruvate/2-oxoglutarate dehydrogenase complex dihydrolipoamide dehydrogenase (E3) component
MSEHSFDVIVIGAGPAGEVAAGRLADAGLEVAVVEEHLVGGECSFYACMPSKALLRPAQALAEARRVRGAAEAAAGTLDVRAVLRRRDEVIRHLDDSAHLPWLEEKRIVLVRAHGAIAGAREVSAGDDVLLARLAVVVAAGTGALLPPIPGLREAKPWTNREATTAEEIPPRLVVLGGGPVGCELAQAYATLGSEVALVEAAPRLLPREEPFASEQVTDALREAGVDVRLGTKAVEVRRDEKVTVSLDDGGTLVADELLAAVGRRARTEDLGLEVLGLEPGRPIEVGDDLRVADHPWLYVIGDANGRALLTHMGKYQARIAADGILGTEHPLRSDGPLSPRVTFTEPQVAAVGHTLESARDAGLDPVFVEAEPGTTAGGSYVGRGAPGRVRLVIDRDREVIVGATFTGVDVAEFLHAATIAIQGEVPMERIWHAVPAFPTRSEVWLELLEAYEAERAAEPEPEPAPA